MSGAWPARLRLSVELARRSVTSRSTRTLPTRGCIRWWSQDSPEERDRAPDLDDQEMMEDPRGDYELRAVSAVLSSDPGFPGQLRYLKADKYELSPNAGWVLEPGTHTVEVVVDAPWAYVAVDGTIRDIRQTSPQLQPGAAQLLNCDTSRRSE